MAALAFAIGATLAFPLAAELGHGAFPFRPHGVAAVAAEWSSGCHRVHNALRGDFAQGGYLRRNGIDATIEAMTSITPIQESASEHLRNALQILVPGNQAARRSVRERDTIAARGRILAALKALSEPSPAMIAATKKLLDTHQAAMEMEPDYDRMLRDFCAVILKAQVEGV